MLKRFTVSFEKLPEELNIFPLPGALLLPGGRLPLNIFEPRYVNLILDSLNTGRLMGMVQTLDFYDDPVPDNARLFETGCAGRIVSFAEVSDDRLGVVIDGVCRFKLVSERTSRNGYRVVQPDFKPYAGDMSDDDQKIDRVALTELLAEYFRVEKIKVDWETIENIADRDLVANLAMACPFKSQEKQALLEARDFSHMTQIITALMEMAVKGGREPAVKH